MKSQISRIRIQFVVKLWIRIQICIIFQGRCLFVHVPPLDQPYSGPQLTEALSVILHQIRGQLMEDSSSDLVAS